MEQETEGGTGNTKRHQKRVKAGISGLLIFLLAFVVFMWLNFTVVEVTGTSMMPNYLNGERVLVSKAYWLVGGIKQGDVVVMKPDDGPHVIKRVYRLAGEKVEFKNVPDRYSITSGAYFVPEGTIYVLGDNRRVSEDSRQYGPVKLDKIVGKVVMKL